MLVLSIIGAIVAIILVYMFVTKVNSYTMKKYDYEFFNFITYGISAAGYVLIYYGHQWYQNAIADHSDSLNGVLIMLIGIVMISLIIYINFKNTPVKLSLMLTPVQQILYAALAVVGFMALVLGIAYLMQTKPVYQINND